MHRARSLLVRTVSSGALLARRGGNGGGGGSGGSSGGGIPLGGPARRPRIRVPLDGHPAGYVLVAILAGALAFGAAEQLMEEEHRGDRKRKRPADQQLSAVSTPSAQPISTGAAPTSPSAASAVVPFTPSSYSLAPFQWSSPVAPTVHLLTSLSANEVAAHPLLQSVGRFGLPQLPLVPVPASGSSSDFSSSQVAPFHLSPPLLLKHSFLSSFNTKTRTPDWTLERLAPGSSSSVSRDSCNFHADAHVAAAFQSHTSDYRASGFDRGHLVPAADVPRIAGIAGSADAQAAVCETFSLTNIAPQVPKLNRGYWLQLENHMRTLANTHEVFVLTGPLWIPTANAHAATRHSNEEANDPVASAPYQLNTGVLASNSSGTSFVHVPSHLFKVVLLAPASDSSSSPLLIAAFILPNTAISLATPLRDFQVPLEQVELYAGWQFFPRLHRPTSLAQGGGDTKSRTRNSLQRDVSTTLLPACDLCTAGACNMKLKEFHFRNNKQ